MTLLPSEKKVLDRLAGDLRAQEPRLTSMFGIFTRLTAPDGQPPEEDSILPRPGRQGTGRRAHRRLLLVVLTVTLLAMFIAVALTGIF